jgi:uncharacterized repeat protein (TIGR03847 family)
MSASFDLKGPDFFTAGTVGPPGQRVFYLQAREEDVLVTLKAEKEQVAALAEYLGQLLAKLPGAVEPAPGDLALLEPIAPAWAIGSIGVAYEEAAGLFILVAEEAQDEDAEGEAASARIRLSRAQALAFVQRAQALVKAGRPPCPVCGQPKNPEGHVCPRSNGHLLR